MDYSAWVTCTSSRQPLLALFLCSLWSCSKAPSTQLDSGPPPLSTPEVGVRLDAGQPDEVDLGNPGADMDAGTPDLRTPEDLGNADLGPEDLGGPCEMPPGQAFEIDRSIVLCNGVFNLPVGPNNAAVRITQSGISIVCQGTVFENTSGFGTTELPTNGFLLEGVDDVTIEGCGARGFRYGLVARDVRGLDLSSMSLSDNFSDPTADWVQDSVQGGGIRFDRVMRSAITNSNFARNWNGLELRDSSGVVVRGNIADHCSNTGATLVNAHDNTLENNDMSWGIRGDNLSYPGRWYGIDTKDSAGIIIDDGSSNNQILNNDFSYGGDGVFIRSVIGACAPNNLVQGNDTSFSPHNAIECWCDGNQFIDNIASDSHYGIWLGGTDQGRVVGNTVERNIVDGISIQIGEDRHSIIENNRIAENGRMGVLLTGREVQVWHNLDYFGPNLANSSHLIVQGNTFQNNGPCGVFANCDIFVQSTRSVLLASNCSAGQLPTPALQMEAEGVWSLGSCGADVNDQPPVASLAPVSATAQVPALLDAAGSIDPEAGALGFHWLVQRAGIRFTPAALPELLYLGPGDQTLQVTFPSGGLWDVSVTVNDGARAGMAHRTVAVAPGGLELGATANQWSFRCTDPICDTQISDDTMTSIVGNQSVLVSTQEPFGHAAYTPPGRDLNLNASNYTRIAGFFRAENQNPFGWQGNFPTFVLGSAQGTITLTPDANLLPIAATEWIYVEAPLAGGEGWTRSQVGAPSLADVDFIEVHTDTWDFGRYFVWIDALSLF